MSRAHIKRANRSARFLRLNPQYDDRVLRSRFGGPGVLATSATISAQYRKESAGRAARYR